MDLDDVAKNLPALFAGLLVAILFIQSGLDKGFDWKGNLEWLTGHFFENVPGEIRPGHVRDDRQAD